MGWRGTLRAIEASSRRAARDAERRDKAKRKEAELEYAESTATAFRDYLTQITTLHIADPATIDWHARATATEPKEPRRASHHEDQARNKLETYKPTFLARLLKLENRRRISLQNAIDAAAEQDKTDFAELSERYEQAHATWKDNKDIAERLLAGDATAFINAIRTANRFEQISDIGTKIEVRVTDDRGIYFDLNVMSEEVVPSEKYTLLQSGRLSTREMPKGEFFELYKDYVCSCLLRVAVEAFATIPIKSVVVTALDEMINPKNGLLEKQALVSAFIPKETLDKLNLKNVDPSDAMQNFLHNMNFKKTRGFEPVNAVEHPSPCF